MTQMKEIALPDMPRLESLAAFRAALLEARRQPVRLVAANASGASAALAQLLLAAKAQWDADGAEFVVSSTSDALMLHFKILGLDIENMVEKAI